MFRLGLQVFRERVGDVVDPARARRAAWISAAVTVLVLVGAVVLQVVFAWAGGSVLRVVGTLALLTPGFGLLLFSCFPTARPPDPAATINGRQVRPDLQTSVRWSVQPYLGRRAIDVAPGDRAAVLNDVPLLQRGLVRRLSRFGPMLVGLALVGVGTIVAAETRTPALLWTVLYLGLLPDMVVRLGRSERARHSAVAAPPPPPESDAPRWHRDPSGSKLRLPGE